MPEIKNVPSLRVAYVTERGSFDDAMPRGFARLFDWLQRAGIQPSGRSLAIFRDDPAKVPPAEQRCEMCVPVDGQVQGAGEIQFKTVGGTSAATMVYMGRADRDQAYHDLYDWLHGEGYHECDAPVETYLSQLGEELRAEIAVPIGPADSNRTKATAPKRASGTTSKRTTTKKTRPGRSS